MAPLPTQSEGIARQERRMAVEPLSSRWLYISGNWWAISFPDVQPVTLPAAKTTSYLTNRASEKPKGIDIKGHINDEAPAK